MDLSDELQDPVTDAGGTFGNDDHCRTCRVHTDRLHLRAIGQSRADLEYAYQLLTDHRVSSPFRWHGATLSFDSFVEDLFMPLLVGFVAVSRTNGERRGMTLVTSPDLRDGHAYLSVVSDPESLRTGRMIEGLIATVEFAFNGWPLHKLYADVDELALPQFKSVRRRGVVEEGVFYDHLMRDGTRINVHRLALFRNVWDQEWRDAIRRLGVRLSTR